MVFTTCRLKLRKQSPSSRLESNIAAASSSSEGFFTTKRLLKVVVHVERISDRWSKHRQISPRGSAHCTFGREKTAAPSLESPCWPPSLDHWLPEPTSDSPQTPYTHARCLHCVPRISLRNPGNMSTRRARDGVCQLIMCSFSKISWTILSIYSPQARAVAVPCPCSSTIQTYVYKVVSGVQSDTKISCGTSEKRSAIRYALLSYFALDVWSHGVHLERWFVCAIGFSSMSPFWEAASSERDGDTPGLTSLVSETLRNKICAQTAYRTSPHRLPNIYRRGETLRGCFHVLTDAGDDAPSRKETSHVLVRLTTKGRQNNLGTPSTLSCQSGLGSVKHYQTSSVPSASARWPASTLWSTRRASQSAQARASATDFASAAPSAVLVVPCSGPRRSSITGRHCWCWFCRGAVPRTTWRWSFISRHCDCCNSGCVGRARPRWSSNTFWRGAVLCNPWRPIFTIRSSDCYSGGTGRATCSGPRGSSFTRGLFEHWLCPGAASFTGTLCEFRFRRGTPLCDFPQAELLQQALRPLYCRRWVFALLRFTRRPFDTRSCDPKRPSFTNKLLDCCSGSVGAHCTTRLSPCTSAASSRTSSRGASLPTSNAAATSPAEWPKRQRRR